MPSGYREIQTQTNQRFNYPQVHEFEKLKVTAIASGSTGNAVLVQGVGDDKGIMIDLGVAYKHIKPYELNIDAVCYTHLHKDHWKQSTMDKLKVVNPKCLYIEPQGSGIPYLRNGVNGFDATIPHNTWAVIKNKYRVMCIPTPHAVPNVAWIVQFLDTGATYFHATDLADISHISCKGADIYGLEANYSDVMELVNRKNGHEVVSATTHLSTENALAWFELNKTEHSKLILLHESKIFN